MKTQLSAILIIIVTFQLFFMAVFLFTNSKGKVLSNRLLATSFLFMGFNLIDVIMSVLNLYKYFDRLAMLDVGVMLTFGPLFYLYSKSIVYKNFKFTKKTALHFVPFVFVSGFIIISFNLNPPEIRQQLVQKINNYELPIYSIIISQAFYIHLCYYLYRAYKVVTNYRKIIQEKFSSIDKINLSWLDFMIRSFTAIILVSFFQNFVPFFSEGIISEVSLIVLILFIFYFINSVLFKALNQPEIFSGISQEEEAVKYAGSQISREDMISYQKIINKHMEEDKSYLNPKLTIDELAEKLDISSKKLSQIINEAFGKSFFDFINSYRIDEAKKLFSESKDTKMTILEIMYESGFNSKSSFNSFFKKLTGQTPSEYKKSLKNSSTS